ncbi:MAG: Asp23/Gls24 family envelope stress response protein [Atopobiaceae bacterium]|uniref:Asp23/Gls24 family envelope stress response protein n=1 Tax=Olsenella absiana TaxID=3115222 RepID=A0ABU7R7G7_9ACTN|nr:Asp23/Gls24 family envelope stress response protein [Atopobiaceae bacterium]
MAKKEVARDEAAEEPAVADVETEPEGSDIPVEDEDLESEDSLTFSNGVIEKIVAIAMRDVPGVVGMKGGWINRVQDALGAADPRKGVSVEVTPDSSVRVNISVLMEYGAYAPQVFEDVKKTVVKQVTGMTGLEIAGVNLRIEDVLTPEEVRARRNEGKAEAEAAVLPAQGDAAQPEPEGAGTTPAPAPAEGTQASAGDPAEEEA